MATQVRIYRVALDDQGNLERTALLEYNPVMDVEEFTIVSLGDLNERIEQEENVFETDDIGVTVEGLPQNHFRDYSSVVFAPWIFEVKLPSGRVWHGVIDPEQIKYDHGSRRHDFDVLSYEYLWSETDLPARSKFDTEIIKMRTDSAVTEVGLPFVTEEGLDMMEDVLKRGTELVSPVAGLEGRGNVLIVDGEAGETRAEIQGAYREGDTVWCRIDTPSDQTLYNSEEDAAYEALDIFGTYFPRTTPGGGNTTVSVRVRSTRLANLLDELQPPFLVEIEADNGNTLSWEVRTGSANYTIEKPTEPGQQPLVRFNRRVEGQADIASQFEGQDFSLLIEKETTRDFDAGANVSVLSQIIYNTGADVAFAGVTNTRFVAPILQSIGNTPQMFALGEMLSGVTGPAGTFPTYIELPENLRASIGLIARRNENLYRFVPILDENDLPRYEIDFLSRQEIIESDAVAAKDVIAASEDAAEWSVPAVIVTPNKDYFKPAGVDEVAGWYYETADGTPISDVPESDLRQYTKPAGAEVLEVEVADVPSYTGRIFGSGGNAVRNDTRLKHIAETFYRFYKGLARNIQLTVKGELDDIVGKYLSFAELGLEDQFDVPEGRVVWVREASVTIEGDRTTIKGRIGSSSITVDPNPHVRIRGRRAYEVDPGNDLEVIFGTYAVDPAGGELDYTWRIGADENSLSEVNLVDSDSSADSALRLFGADALTSGSYVLEVEVVSSESGLSASDTRRIIVFESQDIGGIGNFNDPFRLRKFNRLVNGTQYGVLQIRFMFARADIEEIRAARASGDELPENFEYDLTISDSDPDQVFEIDAANTAGFEEDEVVFEIRVELDEDHTSTIAFEVESSGSQSIDPGTVVTFDTKTTPLITNEGFFIDGTGTGFLSARGDTDVDEMRWDTATSESGLATDPSGLTGITGNRIDFEEVVQNASEGQRWFVRVFALSNDVDDFDDITLSAVRGESVDIPDDPTFDSVIIENVGVFGGSGSSSFYLRDITNSNPADLSVRDLTATEGVTSEGSMTVDGNTALGGDVDFNSRTYYRANDNRFEFENGAGALRLSVGWLGGVDQFDEDGNNIGTYGSNQYGVVALPGNQLVFSGDWEDGSLVIGADAGLYIRDENANVNVITLGTDAGNAGLFLRDINDNLLASFQTSGWQLNASGDFLSSDGTFQFGGPDGIVKPTTGNIQVGTRIEFDGNVLANQINTDTLFSQVIEVGGRLFASDGTTEVVRFGEGSQAAPATPENLTSTVSFTNVSMDWNASANVYSHVRNNQSVASDSVFRLDVLFDISNLNGGGNYFISVSDVDAGGPVGNFTGEYESGDNEIELRGFIDLGSTSTVSISLNIAPDDTSGDGDKNVSVDFSYDAWKPTYALNDTGFRVRLTDEDSSRITGLGSGEDGGALGGGGASDWSDLNNKPFEILSGEFAVVGTNEELELADNIKNELVTGVSGSGNGTLTIQRRGINVTTDLSHNHAISDVDFADQQLNTGSSPTFSGLYVGGSANITDNVDIGGDLDVRGSDYDALFRTRENNQPNVVIGYRNTASGTSSYYAGFDVDTGDFGFVEGITAISSSNILLNTNGDAFFGGDLDVGGTLIRSAQDPGGTYLSETSATNALLIRSQLDHLVLQAGVNDGNRRSITLRSGENTPILYGFRNGNVKIPSGDLDVTGKTFSSDGYNILDNRGSDPIPNDWHDKAVGTFFNDQIPTGRLWDAGLTIKGWTNNHYSWQIIGSANSNDTALHKWYLRSGRGTSWNSLRQIITDDGLGNVEVSGDLDVQGTFTVDGDVDFNSRTYYRANDNRFEFDNASGANRLNVGWLGGVPEFDEDGNNVGTYGSNQYGVVALPGNQLVFNGDWEDGSLVIGADANLFIRDPISGENIITLGTDSGDVGLFLNSTTGNRLSEFTTDGWELNASGDFLRSDGSFRFGGSNGITKSGSGNITIGSDTQFDANVTFTGILSGTTGDFSGTVTSSNFNLSASSGDFWNNNGSFQFGGSNGISKGTTGAISIGSNVNINADISANNVVGGSISSLNYSPKSNSVFSNDGTKIDLSNGSIETKRFAVTSDGEVNARAGEVGGWGIDGVKLFSANGKVQIHRTRGIQIRSDADNELGAITWFDEISGNPFTTSFIQGSGDDLRIRANDGDVRISGRNITIQNTEQPEDTSDEIEGNVRFINLQVLMPNLPTDSTQAEDWGLYRTGANNDEIKIKIPVGELNAVADLQVDSVDGTTVTFDASDSYHQSGLNIEFRFRPTTSASYGSWGLSSSFTYDYGSDGTYTAAVQVRVINDNDTLASDSRTVTIDTSGGGSTGGGGSDDDRESTIAF